MAHFILNDYKNLIKHGQLTHMNHNAMNSLSPRTQTSRFALTLKKLTMKFVLLTTLSLTATLSTGCSAGKAGSIAITSQNKSGASLAGEFTTGFYRYDNKNQITVLLLDGTGDAPRQAVTVRMFWNPRAGRTPIDKTATNATIHYVIFPAADRKEVGIYSGAGFLFPKGTPGDAELTLQMWESTLRLTDSTAGFKDLLGPANLKGSITLKQDDVELERAVRKLNAAIRETLGFPRMVEVTESVEQFAAAD